MFANLSTKQLKKMNSLCAGHTHMCVVVQWLVSLLWE